MLEELFQSQHAMATRVIPGRVAIALNFVAMMRSTGKQAAYEGGPTAEITMQTPERGAYNAALETLRNYFTGENPEGAPSPDRDEPPQAPPRAEGVMPVPPAPPAAPAAAPADASATIFELRPLAEPAAPSNPSQEQHEQVNQPKQ